jgi:hypothetical protein
LAEPNTVIIDSVTRRQIGELLECRDIDTIALKGLPDPVRIWQNRFVALRTATLSPLVGREAELNYLLQRWRKARDGEGGAVIVSGDAGIGKSRLIAALDEILEDEGAGLCSRGSLRVLCAVDKFLRNERLFDAVGDIPNSARSSPPACCDLSGFCLGVDRRIGRIAQK